MASNTPTPSRRAMLGFLAAAPLAAALPVAAISAAPAHDLISALQAHQVWTDRLDAGHGSEAEWAEWEWKGAALYQEVTALPNTVTNARIKAVAVMTIYQHGDLEDMIDDDSVAGRLACQIIRALGSN